MAGRVVGSISLKATVDGPSPIDARLAGEKAGVAMGDGMDSGWGKRAEKTFARIGKRFEVLGGDSGDRAGKSFGQRFKAAFTKIRLDGANWISTAFARTAVAADASTKSIDRNAASLKHWQAITLAITALILGAGNDIAVLGSAVGAGVFVLGSALTSLGIGTAVAVTAFFGLGRSLDELPASVRPAAKAFQALGGVFKDLQTDLTVAAFKNSEQTFKLFGTTVKALTPALERVAAAVGGVVDQIVNGIAPGTKTFDSLNRLIDQSVPVFQKASKVAGAFGRAILTAFASPRMAKSVDKLLDWLGQLGDAFERFTSGTGLDKWLDHADTTFGAVGRLAANLGNVLNSLVSDKAVKQLSDFLDSVGSFLPTAGALIQIGGELDPLTLIGKALDEIGRAIQPLVGPLLDLGESLHNVAMIMLDEWGDALSTLSQNLAPLVQDFADFLGGLDEKTIRGVADALLAFAAAAVVAKGVNGIAGLADKLITLNGAIEKTAGQKTALKGLGGILAGAFSAAIVSGAGSKDNPLETVLQSWASALVGGLLVGGPIGAALGLVAGILYSLIFDNDTFQKASTQMNDWARDTFWVPITIWLLQTTNAYTEWWDTTFAGWNNFWNEVLIGITGWLGNMALALQTGLGGPLDTWNKFWDDTYTTLTTFAVQGTLVIGGFLGGILTNIISWASDAIGNWNKFWGDVYSTVVTNVALAVNWVKNGFNGLLSWWNGLWPSFTSALSNAWSSATSIVRNNVNTMIGIVNGLLGPLNSVISLFNKLTGLKVPNISIPSLPKTAVGGIFGQAQARIIGEAGREAVVPLDRPLSQVDPSVRGLSAYAQGKGDTTATTSSGAQVTFMPGSIVSPYSDPALVAEQAADKVAEKLAV